MNLECSKRSFFGSELLLSVPRLRLGFANSWTLLAIPALGQLQMNGENKS